MKKFLLNLLIPVLTFALGIGVYRIALPTVSIETISDYTFFYNGRDVQIETYVKLRSPDGNVWYLGEPFSKNEAVVFLDLENNSTYLGALHSQLKEDLSDRNFKFAKVLIRGTVEDNCSPGAPDNKFTDVCCYNFRLITIKAQEVIQLEPVETYTLPQ